MVGAWMSGASVIKTPELANVSSEVTSAFRFMEKTGNKGGNYGQQYTFDKCDAFTKRNSSSSGE